jgi:hypothetical protein
LPWEGRIRKADPATPTIPRPPRRRAGDGRTAPPSPPTIAGRPPHRHAKTSTKQKREALVVDYSYKPAGNSFTETTVDSHAPGDAPRLVVDASGGVHALYHDTFFNDLDYAYRCP